MAPYSFITLSYSQDPITETYAAGINNNGQIAGYYGALGSYSGFLWTGGSYRTLAHPGSNQTNPQSINDAGLIVGIYSIQGSGFGGFLYNGFTYTDIVDPSALPSSTAATGINNAGQIVGYYYGKGLDPGTHGFLYSGGTYTELNDPLAINGTFAEGINALGQIVGYYVDVNGNAHGFLYSNGQYTTLDDPSPSNRGTFAQGINRWATSSDIISTATAPITDSCSATASTQTLMIPSLPA
jgi:probable HAF family extracellular repeat protein